MSNGTQEHNPNRNRNRNNGNRNRNNGNRNRSNSNSSNSSNPNKPRQVSQHQSFVNRAPAKKLSFWQKLLKMIGLYKEPVRPGRNDQKSASPKTRDESRPPSNREPRGEKQAPRSNTRDARNTGEARPPREPRAPREPRERREPSLADVESTRLYIGNLSYDASESDIEELFKGVGPVRNVEIVYNKHTHKSKGYGFVEMLRIDEAKRAVEVLHDQHFMGRQLIVSGAKAKNAEEGEEAAVARDRKDQYVSASATTSAAPAAEESVAPVAEVTAAETAAAEPIVADAIVEEVHSLEGDSQKETFV
jgi:RNA recognition motif. (a.k.a. RRM, RBD, or RNP domain)